MAQEKTISTFQIIIMVVFGLAIVLGVMMFAGFINFGGSGATVATGTVTIWGTVPKTAMSPYIETFEVANPTVIIDYIEQNADTFDSNLVEALASGRGPDIAFLNQDSLLKNKERIFVIPYTSLAQRTIQDTYIREASLLLGTDGVWGVPILVDPLVLYYNRDIFDTAGIPNPPKTWEDVAAITPSLTMIDPTTNRIKQSAIALGGYSNIENAKDILSTFMLQSGADIVKDDGGFERCTLTSSASEPNSQLAKNIAYFMQFSDQTNPDYTWNAALTNSHDLFISGKLAMYIGHASELFSLQQQNPNFSYDVVQIPQFKSAPASATYGTMLSASIMKSSKNFTAAYTVLTALATAPFETKLSAGLSLPPARRDLLAINSDNAYVQTFYNSALYSRGWLDPNKVRTDGVMRDFTNSLSSGQLNFAGSVSDLCSKFDSITAEIGA